ncbi:hypothetical protein Aduo_008170 [Ancylostoma duodenale]
MNQKNGLRHLSTFWLHKIIWISSIATPTSKMRTKLDEMWQDSNLHQNKMPLTGFQNDRRAKRGAVAVPTCKWSHNRTNHASPRGPMAARALLSDFLPIYDRRLHLFRQLALAGTPILVENNGELKRISGLSCTASRSSLE